MTAIFTYCRNGDLQAVQTLLQQNNGVAHQNNSILNQREPPGNTPLHIASMWHRLDVVQELIEHGADVNAKADDGWTPLHDAVDVQNFEIVKYLLDHGANSYESDNNGHTVLDMDTSDAIKNLIRQHRNNN